MWGIIIGSAVLTFIGYKQTDTQTDRQAKFIYRYTDLVNQFQPVKMQIPNK